MPRHRLAPILLRIGILVSLGIFCKLVWLDCDADWVCGLRLAFGSRLDGMPPRPE